MYSFSLPLMRVTIPPCTQRKHFWLRLQEFTRYISDAQIIQLPPQVYYFLCKLHWRRSRRRRRTRRRSRIPSQAPVIASASRVDTFHLRYVRQLYVQPSLFRSGGGGRRSAGGRGARLLSWTRRLKYPLHAPAPDV